MTYTQPPAKTAGDPTLASDWNVYVKDNLIHLRALVPDAGASNLPLVSSSTTTATFAQVDTAGIKDSAITAGKIGTDAVVTAKIQDSAVTNAKIAAGTIARNRLVAAAQIPIGGVQMYAGGGLAPSGWLYCLGQSVSRSTYSALFDAIGTTYGSVDANSFTLPDLTGKFVQGAGTGYVLAGTGGAATIPNHTHTLPDHNHGIPQHTHRVSVTQTVTSGSPSSTNGGTSGTTQYANANHTHQVTINTDPQSDNSASGTNVDNKTSFSTNNSGGGGENRPPFLTLNFIIYAGV